SARAPLPPTLASHLSPKAIRTQMTARRFEGGAMDKTLAWGGGEVEGFLRTWRRQSLPPCPRGAGGSQKYQSEVHHGRCSHPAERGRGAGAQAHGAAPCHAAKVDRRLSDGPAADPADRVVRPLSRALFAAFGHPQQVHG